MAQYDNNTKYYIIVHDLDILWNLLSSFHRGNNPESLGEHPNSSGNNGGD
jgi:hypothetical protein